MKRPKESIKFNDDIPINLRAQTLTHAIIDKLQYMLSKLEHNQEIQSQDISDLDAFSHDLNILMINNPQDFNSSEQDYIGSIYSSATKLAKLKEDSKTLIIIEANAQTLLNQLQNNS